MYIFIYPDQTIDVREEWDTSYYPPTNTYIYEPRDADAWVQVINQGNRNMRSIKYGDLPPYCKAVELLYPRAETRKPDSEFKKESYFKTLNKQKPQG